MAPYKPIVLQKLFTCLGLAGVAGAAVATTRWGEGLVEFVAWIVLALCAGGVVNLLQGQRGTQPKP